MAARSDDARRYGAVAIAFHWTIAALVLLNIVLGIVHEELPRPISREVMGVHKSIGLTVLVLTLLRLGWRLTHRPPPLPSALAGWEKGLAHLVHWLFYIFMVALPVTGWWMAAGPTPHPFEWFGLFTVPEFPAQAGADAAHSAHVVLGWTMLGLVVLHIGGALRHHFVLRDGVLGRMVPGIVAQPR